MRYLSRIYFHTPQGVRGVGRSWSQDQGWKNNQKSEKSYVNINTVGM